MCVVKLHFESSLLVNDNRAYCSILMGIIPTGDALYCRQNVAKSRVGLHLDCVSVSL